MPRFRRVLGSRAAIAVTGAFHMHVFSAAGAEKEVLGRHKCISDFSLVSLCPFCSFPFPCWLLVFFFLNLFSPFPLFLLLLLPLPLLLPLFVYPFLALCSYFPCLCYVGFHAVLSETSNQQQQDWTEPELFLRKATQQCEIDGVCSQMRSASLHCVCVSEYVCLSFAGWRDECRLKWMRE